MLFRSGFDLSTLNMQRGRDHGLADYNAIRTAYGLHRVNSFAQITSDNGLQRKLRDLYGNVDNIDAWVGGLAEDHVPGTSTGPLLRAVLLNQFTRLRSGDRFWFENVFSGPVLDDLENTTLAAVVSRNTEITNLQSNVFFFRFSISGTVFHDANDDGVQALGESGLGGRTVQLLDALTLAVLATTTTDRDGHYLFNNFNDIGPGQFLVHEVPQPNWVLTTPNDVYVAISRGDQFVTVNFGNGNHGGNGPAASVFVASFVGLEPDLLDTDPFLFP